MARPRKFDEAQALEKAMGVFWSKGYAGTSIDDLVEATGASRASLYSVWGDKDALYRAALECYAGHAGDLLATLERDPPLEAVKDYVRRIGDLAAAGNSCFVVDTMMNPVCPESARGTLPRAQLDRVEAALHRALLRSGIPEPLDHARHLAVALQALFVQGRAGTPSPTIDAFVRITLSTLPETPCSSSS